MQNANFLFLPTRSVIAIARKFGIERKLKQSMIELNCLEEHKSGIVSLITVENAIKEFQLATISMDVNSAKMILEAHVIPDEGEPYFTDFEIRGIKEMYDLSRSQALSFIVGKMLDTINSSDTLPKQKHEAAKLIATLLENKTATPDGLASMMEKLLS